MSRALVSLTLCVLAACGGATETDLYGDASTTDGGGGKDATTDGGTVDARPDVTPVDCKALIADVTDLRDNAVKCNFGTPVTPCDIQIDDLCCPLTVSGPANRKELADFEAAVKAAKAANCQVGCPATPCASKPTLKCPNGTCQQF